MYGKTTSGNQSVRQKASKMIVQASYLLSILACISAQESNKDRFGLHNLFRVPCWSGPTEKRFCVPLRSCPSLLAQVRNKNPGRIFQYLNDYTFPCMIPGQVCCPGSQPWTNPDKMWTWPTAGEPLTSTLPPRRITSSTTHATTTIKTKPKRKPPQQQVSNKTRHKNRRLLPEDTCGLDFGQRVLGGQETDLEEHPWLAVLRLQYGDGRRAFICGGSIISSRYILTAAHCLHPNSLPVGSKVDMVRVGEHNLKTSTDCNEGGHCNSQPQDMEIDKRIVHEEYTPSEPGTFNDIALIRLKKDIQYNLNAQPICLPLDSIGNKQYEGKKLTTVGWGKTSNGAKTNSMTKQKVNVPVVPMSVCAVQYRARRISLRDTQICAGGEEGKDSCQGDSGGPLMSSEMIGNEVRWFIQGVVSTGPKDCGKADNPALYTRVGKYVKWILDNIHE